MLEIHLQLAIHLHAGDPSPASYPSVCRMSVCSYYPSRVGLEWEGHHAACWFPDSSAVDTGDVDSGRRLRYGDADWDVD